MKKLIIISAITALFFTNSPVNGQWTNQDSGYESPWILFDNSFPAGQNDIGYVGGMKTTYNGPGVILKTVDKGNTWTTILGGEDESLFGIEAIYFTSVNVGYAVGWNENILHTTDGGANWTPMSVGSSIYYYTDVEFWDADHGIVSAKRTNGLTDQVWVTEDGGNTWTPATGINMYIIDIAYADENTLFAACGEEDIYKSTDGGYTWSLNYDGSNPYNDPLLGVHFGTNKFGVVGGMDGTVIITTDGGNSWSKQTVGGYASYYAIQCFDTDSIYVGGTDEIIFKSLDGGISWTLTSGGGTDAGSLYQFAFTDDRTGYVTGSDGTILTQIPTLTASFSADETTVCYGGSVNFTDNSFGGATSWSWTFEGGTPETSTEQNPTVVYSTPGVYDVELTVSDGTNTDTEIKYDFISVISAPGQPDMPTGNVQVCTDESYTYETNEVEDADSYEWELSTDLAGTLNSSNTNSVVLNTSEYWTGDFSIRVRALNSCGEGIWSDELDITMFLSPYDFEVQGDGIYCEGSDGAEITLSASETGVSYELYLDGTATGNIVEGTGTEISFGGQTTEGIYTVYATNDNCTVAMLGEVEVIAEPTPAPVVDGESMVCDYTSSEYTTEDHDGSTYTWEVTGGTIADGQGTSMITVDWAASGSGSVVVTEETNGCSGDSEVFEVVIDDCTGLTEQSLIDDVTIYPNPAKHTINIKMTVDQGAEYSLGIYNTLGQLMYSSKETGNGSIQTKNVDVNHFPQGLYFIRLVSDKGMLWQGKFEKLN